MEKIEIEKWISDSGYGDGYGSGYGCGYGSGYGSGSGSGSGSGDGYGDGYGSGYGSGDGDGSGSGSGSGDGSGDGYGDGYGSGYGYGIKKFNNDDVFLIDDVQTIITNIIGDYAKGYILNSDLTLKKCYLAKGKGFFAHGETLRDAANDLHRKIMDDMDTDEKIQIILKDYEHGKKYPTMQFYELHSFLTGSCKMGRDNFAEAHNVDLAGEMTMDEFIELTEDDYGGEIIKQLKEAWESCHD